MWLHISYFFSGTTSSWAPGRKAPWLQTQLVRNSNASRLQMTCFMASSSPRMILSSKITQLLLVNFLSGYWRSAMSTRSSSDKFTLSKVFSRFFATWLGSSNCCCFVLMGGMCLSTSKVWHLWHELPQRQFWFWWSIYIGAGRLWPYCRWHIFPRLGHIVWPIRHLFSRWYLYVHGIEFVNTLRPPPEWTNLRKF